jgi:hypothetical protein
MLWEKYFTHFTACLDVVITEKIFCPSSNTYRRTIVLWVIINGLWMDMDAECLVVVVA